MSRRVLICEDEDAIREFVVINLKRAGYQAVGVSSGEAAVETFNQQGGNFDVALLDVMLPGIDGFEVCKKLREKSSQLGIVMLTAKTQEIDRVNGLMIGADDYVSKPFSPSELLARIDALCRRMEAAEKRMAEKDKKRALESGPFSLDADKRVFYKNSVPIELTQVEYQIIEMFMRNKDLALKRSEILKRIWGEEYSGDEKIVDVNIRRIRMKIEDEPSNPKFIETIWGFGYKWPSEN